MKTKHYILVVLGAMCLNTYGQTMLVHSISTTRQPSGDPGYTLDGTRMADGSRLKLLNPINFSSSGTYAKSVSIADGYGTTGSLANVSTLPTDDIFFFGSFNRLDPSTQPFTADEIDSLYNWSLRGGRLIIASGGTFSTFYDASILNSRWGYAYQMQNPSNFTPTELGVGTDIFSGPFGHVTSANQGAGVQGYFSSLTSDSKVLATDAIGNPTLFMDCNTLDLIVADIDGYTDLGGISDGGNINNAQDKFWANTIVFMDKLQPPPVLANDSTVLTLNATYNSYEWYLDNAPISEATASYFAPSENGVYHVEVTVNGGCKVKSNSVTVDGLNQDGILELPNVFTPNNDGLNDFFDPTTMNGITIVEVSIFNRWGKLIHREKSPEPLWDGMAGARSPDGVYYWIVEYQNSKGERRSGSGFIHLMR
jgi:gliding motility-associated-like protein